MSITLLVLIFDKSNSFKLVEANIYDISSTLFKFNSDKSSFDNFVL